MNLNLTREGVDDAKIFLVSNAMIDILVSLRPRFEADRTKARFGLDIAPFAFVALHRPSNVDNRSTFTGICTALGTIQQSINLFWPLHLRTQNTLMKYELVGVVKGVNLITTNR